MSKCGTNGYLSCLHGGNVVAVLLTVLSEGSHLLPAQLLQGLHVHVSAAQHKLSCLRNKYRHIDFRHMDDQHINYQHIDYRHINYRHIDYRHIDYRHGISRSILSVTRNREGIASLGSAGFSFSSFKVCDRLSRIIG
jgi:hypothetical protein